SSTADSLGPMRTCMHACSTAAGGNRQARGKLFYLKRRRPVMGTELNEQSSNQPGDNNGRHTSGPLGDTRNAHHQHSSPARCTSCGAAADSIDIGATAAYVFAIGKIDLRFPSLAIEKEFAQATGRANTKGLTDRAATHAVLSERANRYIVRQVCW